MPQHKLKVLANLSQASRVVLRHAILLERYGHHRYVLNISGDLIREALVQGVIARGRDNLVCLTVKGRYYASLLAA